MSGSSSAGGSRHLSGRRLDPVRSNFETIKTPENLGKSPANQQIRCKLCMEQVSARAVRMRDHLERCIMN